MTVVEVARRLRKDIAELYGYSSELMVLAAPDVIDMLLDEVRKNGHAASVDWARVDEFRPYGGIRIEDDAVVTDTGCELITRDVPVEPDAIEELMRA